MVFDDVGLELTVAITLDFYCTASGSNRSLSAEKMSS